MRALWLSLLVVAACALVPAPVRASSNPSFDSAMSACQNYHLANYYPGPITGEVCNVVTSPGQAVVKGGTLGNGATAAGTWSSNWGNWGFSGPVPVGNPCSTVAPANVYLTGKILSGYSIPANVVDPQSGVTVQCAMSVTPIGMPTMRSDGTWETYGSVAPSGNLATGSGWKDGTGAAVNPQPPIPTLPATNVTAPPSVCSGSSCYNAGTNQYCGSAGGQQYCVSGAAATSSTGGCTASGSAAVCAGQAVIPSPPPAIIPDPATQIQGSDKYTQASPTTGAAMVVTVNAYGLPGTKVTSGQQAGDSGPAPASSTVPPSGYAGGGNCNTPPVCSGDAVMCGVARQTWKSGCDAKAGLDQVHKDLTGDGTTPDLTAGAHTSADVWSDGTNTGNAVADAANAGNYDASGLGFSTTCPLHDMVVPLPLGASFPIKFSAGCVVGGWIKAIVIAFALFAAARITAGGVG